ncbi:C-type lectin domain family 9 member A-like isoform X4 [Mobula birostris]|uniref:C-type lectin domain family 9 member A-like isoform X4 n=1 Tax=Mobula birostris TaxID=1983395 RepID=UPI003B284174
MDEVKTYVNVKFQNTGPQSPSNDGLTSTYSELNFPKDEPLIVENEDPPTASRPGELPITAQTDGLTSTYAVLNFRKGEPHIDQDEDPPIASGPAVMPRTAQAGAHEHESKLKMENRPYRQICPLCLVTSAFIVIVIGLSIHEQACSQDWIRNEDRCYFISKIKSSYDVAKHHCSSSYSKLLEVNSTEKANFVKNALRGQRDSYWIGSCEAGKMGPPVVYKMDAGKFQCSECNAGWLSSCKNYQHRFICEKPTPLCADIPEKIRDLCQKSVGPT